MKDLKKLVDQHVKDSAIADRNEKQKEQSSGFINQIFHNLKLIFPAWRQNFKTENEYLATKELWLNTLIDEGVNTQEQIDRALKGAKLSDTAFFPSIGKFITWSQKAAPRVNEQAYQAFTYDEIQPHTQDEYKEFAKKGMDKVRESLHLKDKKDD